ncbi:hypothetical protein JOB18_025414 [Solea senegalensis]|nr:hypothetical protein JOB18_025414 [Solea senegalensis]
MSSIFTSSASSALSLSVSLSPPVSLSVVASVAATQTQLYRNSVSDKAVTWTQLNLQDCSHKQEQEEKFSGDFDFNDGR